MRECRSNKQITFSVSAWIVFTWMVTSCASLPSAQQTVWECMDSLRTFQKSVPPTESEMFLSHPPVERPAAARNHGVEGCAVLTFDVNGEGRAQNIRVLTEAPKGYFFGNNAVEALMKSEFAKVSQINQALFFTFGSKGVTAKYKPYR